MLVGTEAVDPRRGRPAGRARLRAARAAVGELGAGGRPVLEQLLERRALPVNWRLRTRWRSGCATRIAPHSCPWARKPIRVPPPAGSKSMRSRPASPRPRAARTSGRARTRRPPRPTRPPCRPARDGPLAAGCRPPSARRPPAPPRPCSSATSRASADRSTYANTSADGSLDLRLDREVDHRPLPFSYQVPPGLERSARHRGPVSRPRERAGQERAGEQVERCFGVDVPADVAAPCPRSISARPLARRGSSTLRRNAPISSG